MPFFAATVLDAFPHVVAAMLCAFVAIAIWDVTSRTVRQIAGDATRCIHERRSLLRGTLRFLVGLFFIVVAVTSLRSLVPPEAGLEPFTLVASMTFIVALVLDSLIGASIRRLLGIT